MFLFEFLLVLEAGNGRGISNRRVDQQLCYNSWSCGCLSFHSPYNTVFLYLSYNVFVLVSKLDTTLQVFTFWESHISHQDSGCHVRLLTSLRNENSCDFLFHKTHTIKTPNQVRCNLRINTDPNVAQGTATSCQLEGTERMCARLIA